MKLLVKFPTRGRWDKFAETFHKYQTMKVTDDVTFLVTIDKDDQAMNRPDRIKNFSQWGNVIVDVIDPCGKIGAINAGIDSRIADYDIILLASDDMIPKVQGYDRIIIDNMKRLYPDTDGILFFNDGFTGRRLNTLCILGRKYFQRFGYIYHPSYKSLWCDNEFMDVGFILNKQTFFDQVIIQHEHPINIQKPSNPAKMDALNHRDVQNNKADELNYYTRRERNFDLALIIDSNTGWKTADVQKVDEGNRPSNKRGRPRKQSAGV